MDAEAQNIVGKGKEPQNRISKACQECRRRKIKCDGHSMCKNCELSSAICSYRAIVRQRRPGIRASFLHQPSSGDPHPATKRLPTRQEHPTKGSSGNPIPRDDQSHGINSSVSATHIASTSCILQLYYGASSNFSFLQQIHHSLSGDRHESRTNDEVREGGAELDLYGQRSLFFGTSDTKNIPNDHISDSPVMLLSEKIADRFLTDYISTFHQILPFTSAEDLTQKTKELFSNPGLNSLNTANTASLMVVLAIGATMKEDSGWAEMLAEKAKNVANSIGQMVNLQAIQLHLLLAHYETILGRPNSSYLYLGTAVRKTFAAGLHRDTSIHETNHQERRTTIWCLYFFESLTCFTLGRPSSLARSDIGTRYPENQPFILSLIKLSKIISDAAKLMYSSQKSSLLDLCRKAQSVHQELRDYAFDVLERLGIPLGRILETEQLDVKQILLETLYNNTLILTFRPFLIAHVNHQKSSDAGNEAHGLPDTLSWLEEPCGQAVNAARDLIRFLAKAIDQNVVTRGLRFFCYYLEGACFLLIDDALRSWDAKERNIAVVKTGLQCLSKLISGTGSSTNIYTIRRLLEALEKTRLEQAGRIEAAVAGSISAPPQNQGYDLNYHLDLDGSYGRGGWGEMPLDTMVNFPAGWATFQSGSYLSKNAIPEPEQFNPDLHNFNWGFDNILADVERQT
ncbi:fungal-specific transcription factor domain-containing protein [Amylocarpus encephaloides]|uniref:Fungal-specific transcription factor domain-containing protein n=1 Tax=Amylocarpus encephaloides TaxID=45428 RepID=A0A9P7Y9D0_9HELO|nr:fungal-specific transcription factor domain-containing protein [Amylocarpus encephaloides]